MFDKHNFQHSPWTDKYEMKFHAAWLLFCHRKSVIYWCEMCWKQGESLEAVATQRCYLFWFTKQFKICGFWKTVFVFEMDFHFESRRVLVYAKQLTIQESVIFHFLFYLVECIGKFPSIQYLKFSSWFKISAYKVC